MAMQDDLEFFGIDELLMEPCCAVQYYPEIETGLKEKEMEFVERVREEQREIEEDFGDSLVGRIRSALWNVFEYPHTSFTAQVRWKISVFVVITGINSIWVHHRPIQLNVARGHVYSASYPRFALLFKKRHAYDMIYNIACGQ